MTEGWGRYYEVAKGGGPRETLRLALELFESAGGGGERLAVDLGCGEGRDTLELLRRGWRVLAIDAEPEAIERLRARPDLDPDAAARLETRLISFDEAEWPQAHLVNSSFALPFCPPDRFPALWERIASPFGSRATTRTSSAAWQDEHPSTARQAREEVVFPRQRSRLPGPGR